MTKTLPIQHDGKDAQITFEILLSTRAPEEKQIAIDFESSAAGEDLSWG